MTFEDLIRDARERELTPSTRVLAAFNAISVCWQLADMLIQPPTALPLEHSDAVAVPKLAKWAIREAPQGELPMTPEDAVALAGRVHTQLGGE
ncbi:hypothetical protein HDG40_006461 [Paraburkholderia sp. JPY158]|uniref:Uncharacterized protein n=1 Tax=Paraburkholderia atlantica TaxID=2654982 RepID=A0A7W8V9X0_PARAM|nr:hypothetical protein [Paraburkholderia atlantica]MBB5428274.1 hypothetical protein [Paraburkholderia atlantica]